MVGTLSEIILPEHPEGFTPPDDEEPSDSNSGDDQPVQGQVSHSNISARVPESVGAGVFSNGVMVLTGQFEIVLDFVLRIGEQQRVATRCVLPRGVAGQFVGALRENIRNYETRFGPLPPLPKPIRSESEHSESPAESEAPGDAPASHGSEVVHPENLPAPPSQPQIQDIYDELKISEDVMAGHYANAVLIRHSGTEFCFDFITNFFPRSAVSARVFMATPHVRPLLASLERSLPPPPGTSQEFT